MDSIGPFPLVWRCLTKWTLLGLVTTGVLYPHVGLLLKHLHHLRNVDSLIQPELPEIAAINREIDSLLATSSQAGFAIRTRPACSSR